MRSRHIPSIVDEMEATAMTKRIVSGIFLLIALGALGLILAGALTSGEQLIVRFLTAIIVAALGLYVISDLRLHSDAADETGTSKHAPAPTRVATAEEPPPNSTAAFMATVTGKRAGRGPRSGVPAPDHRHGVAPAAAGPTAATASMGEPTVELAQPGARARRPMAVPAPDRGRAQTPPPMTHVSARATAAPAPGLTTPRAVAAEPTTVWEQPGATIDPPSPPVDPSQTSTPGPGVADSPYEADLDAAALWPFNNPAPSHNPAPGDSSDAASDLDALTAIFARTTEQELAREAHDTCEDAAPTHHDRAKRETVEVPSPAPPTAPTPVAAEIGDFLSPGRQDVTERVGAATNCSNDEKSDDDVRPEAETDRLGHLTHEATTEGGDTTSYSGTITESIPVATTGDDTDAGSRGAEPTPLDLMPRTVSAIEAATYTDAPIAPIIDLRTSQASRFPADLEAAIRSGELEVISSLIDQGLLSTSGPITDRDVRTMVYVAFTSSELRKILLAGGTVDSDRSELDLGEVEVFTTGATGPAAPSTIDLDALGADDATMIDLRAGYRAAAAIADPYPTESRAVL
jgi:hypothetical protein